MSLLALGLILVAAFCHAGWNFLAKRVGGGATFTWLFSVAAMVLWTPAAIAVLWLLRPTLGPAELAVMVGSGLLHVAYFAMLQIGYRKGDLSLVYPLARGTGPMLSILAAIVVLGERPGVLGLAGGLLVAASIFMLARTGASGRFVRPEAAVLYGLATGVCIATYTVYDKFAVSALVIPPILLDYASSVTRSVVLAPHAIRNWASVRRHWRLHRREAVGIAALASTAYILVLTAMQFTPVSYVAPAREVSIVIAAVMGARMLGEERAAGRIVAAGAMVLGIAALALG